ncbi:P-type conjugative transfer protein TrbL [Bartonella sp. LJL80]
MNSVGVIDRFLNTFNSLIDNGFGLLNSEVGFIASTLIVIDITIAFLFWAWGADDDLMARLVKKTIYIGAFAYIISNWKYLTDIILKSFAGLGLKATGSGFTFEQMMHPGAVAQVGLDAGRPLIDAMSDLMGFYSFFENFIQIVCLGLAWLIVLIAFFLLAVQLFITLIEFKLTTLAGFVLIPFGLFNKSSFMAEKVLGNVISTGIKVLILGVIVGIGNTLFAEFKAGFGDQIPTLDQAMTIVLAALALLGLGIFGPKIADGLVSGGPQMGAGSAVATGLAVGGAALAGGAAIGMAAKGAMSLAAGGGAAMRGASAIAGGASAAYSMASAGKSGASGIAAGLGGAAKAGASVAVSPLKRAAQSAKSSMAAANASGVKAAYRATGGQLNDSQASTNKPSPNNSALRRSHSATARQGASMAAHAVRSADHGGAGNSVKLGD